MEIIFFPASIMWKRNSSQHSLYNDSWVETITTVIRSGRLRWYGHVIKKSDEDWVKKCMEYRVEGRRPVERPRWTWLESVDADMAKLEIDRNNFMKRKCNPIGKQKLIIHYVKIIIFHTSIMWK